MNKKDIDETQKIVESIENQWYVDVPPSFPEEDTGYDVWSNIATFPSREEAIEFIKKYFGGDDEGRICLLSPP